MDPCPTIGGVLVATTITMTTAGAITTSATSAFASGTTIGNVTYSNNVIAVGLIPSND